MPDDLDIPLTTLQPTELKISKSRPIVYTIHNRGNDTYYVMQHTRRGKRPVGPPSFPTRAAAEIYVRDCFKRSRAHSINPLNIKEIR